MTTKIKVDVCDVKLRPPRMDDADKLFEMFEDCGWLVGLTEIRCWLRNLPEIFVIAEYKGKTIGCINVSNLSADHAYVGNYVVDSPYRFQGIGKRIWIEGVAKAADRGLILASEAENWPMYAKMSFQIDQNPQPINRINKAKLKKTAKDPNIQIEKIDTGRIEEIIQYDEGVTSINRRDYLKAWLLCDEVASFVAISNGKVVGYTVSCLYKDDVHRIGPLFADSVGVAQALTASVVEQVPENIRFTADMDLTDARVKELVENIDEVDHFDLAYIVTKTDVPVDKQRAFFYSQLTVTRT